MSSTKPTTAAAPPRSPRLSLVRQTLRRLSEYLQNLLTPAGAAGIPDQTSFTCNNTQDPAG